MIETYNDSPNYSIVTPAKCNANCSFCYENAKNIDTQIDVNIYFEKLAIILKGLPSAFHQISITGGEPLLCPYLEPILYSILPFKNKYTNIVLTTNGTNLLEKISPISLVIDHINISRHHYDDNENKKIFNGNYNISTQQIKEYIKIYSAAGLDISFNCVINDSTTKEFILNFVEWSKECGSAAISFRKESGTLDILPAQTEFSNHKILSTTECPVCKSIFMIINGMKVYWKYSATEPSEILKDKIYELIYMPDGKIYRDWNKKDEISLNIPNTSSLSVETISRRSSFSGCSIGGYGGGC